MRIRVLSASLAACFLSVTALGAVGAQGVGAATPANQYRSAAGVYKQYVTTVGGAQFTDTLTLTAAHTFTTTHVVGGGPSGTWSQTPLGRITLTGTYSSNGQTINYVLYIWKSVPGLGTAQLPGNVTANGSPFGTWYATLTSR